MCMQLCHVNPVSDDLQLGGAQGWHEEDRRGTVTSWPPPPPTRAGRCRAVGPQTSASRHTSPVTLCATSHPRRHVLPPHSAARVVRRGGDTGHTRTRQPHRRGYRYRHVRGLEGHQLGRSAADAHRGHQRHGIQPCLHWILPAVPKGGHARITHCLICFPFCSLGPVKPITDPPTYYLLPLPDQHFHRPYLDTPSISLFIRHRSIACPLDIPSNTCPLCIPSAGCPSGIPAMPVHRASTPLPVKQMEGLPDGHANGGAA